MTKEGGWQMNEAIVGILLFLISEVGWLEFFRQRTRVRACFVPVCVFSLQTLCLIFCAAAGILQSSARVMYYAGFALLPLSLLLGKRSCFRAWHREGLLVSLAGIALVFFLLYGKVVGHFDNFTHWALIVKHLLSSHALPMAADAVITYTNYPVGSAMWIYYVVSCIGVSTEDIWLFAQSVYMVFCLQSLFVVSGASVGRIRHIITVLFVLLYGNCMLSYNISIYNLLVDTMLPLHAIALTIFVGYECCRMEENQLVINRQLRVNLWGLIPMLCMTTQIKSSGAIFLVLPAAVMIYAACRSELKRHIPALLLAVAAIVLCMFGWSLRHSMVFGENGGRHAASMSLLKENPKDAVTIAYAVLRSMFSGKDMLYLLVPMLLAFTASMLAEEGAADMFLKVFAACAAMYTLYTIGLLGMYLISMPRQEALVLAGFDRYRKSMLIWIHAMIYLSILFSISRILPSLIEKKWVKYAVAGTALTVLFGAWCVYGWKPYGIKTIVDDYRCEELSMRIELEELLQQENIESGGRYQLVLPKGRDSDYYRLFYGYLLSYLTYSADVTVTNGADADIDAGTMVIRLPG